MIDAINGIDFTILNFIQDNISNKVLDQIMIFFTKLGDGGVFWIAIAIILFCIKKTRRLGATVFISISSSAALCSVIIKPLVARLRPFVVTGFDILIPAPYGFSFPSGHATCAFATVSALLVCKNKLWIPVLFIAAIVSFSRLYLYVHFPTDVFVGVLLGMASGFFARKASDFIFLCWNL